MIRLEDSRHPLGRRQVARLRAGKWRRSARGFAGDARLAWRVLRGQAVDLELTYGTPPVYGDDVEPFPLPPATTTRRFRAIEDRRR